MLSFPILVLESPSLRTRQRGSLEIRNREDEDNPADYRLQYLDKRLFVQLNGSRKVIGVLRGYDVGQTPLSNHKGRNIDGLSRFS